MTNTWFQTQNDLLRQLFECPTCRSVGFEVSKLGPNRCTFCDGTEGGNPPTEEEIKEAQLGNSTISKPSTRRRDQQNDAHTKETDS